MKREKIFNRNRVHFLAVLLGSIFLFAGCGGNDDGGGSVLMSSVGQSGADIVAHSAQAGGASLAAPNAQQAQDKAAAKNADKNTIFLSKTSDEIMLLSSPAVYDLSQITVIAPNPAGKPIDRTDYPHTEWTLVSGRGTLNGTVYSTAVAETAVFRAVYSHGGDVNTADFILRVVGLASISIAKTADNLMIAPAAPNAYDLSGIAVTANFSNATSRDVTNDPAAVWVLVSGSGTLNGKLYSAAAVPETSALRVSYTLGGINVTADFALTTFNLSSVTLSKTADNLPLSLTSPAVYDLSRITVTANYSNATSKDVTNDPATIWTLVSGSGTLNGKIFSAAAAPSTAVIEAGYAEYGNAKTAQFNLAVTDMIPPAVALSDNHPDSVVNNGDVIIITATFTENDRMSETPAPSITIGSVVLNAPMTRLNDFCWIYTWNVQPSVYGLQQVSVTAFDASGNRCAPATGKTAYEIKNQDPVKYVYVMQLTGISYTCGVAVDKDGYVYATSQDHSVRKFSPGGVLVKKWGSLGTGNGQFYYPGGIAAGAAGEIYVADEYNSRIQKFDSNGNFILKWGSLGSGNGQFNRQFDVTTDRQGFVYVVDRMNHRVQKFDSNGNFIFKFGGYGSGNGQFSQPLGVKIDSTGNIFVADSFNQRVQKFDSNGNFLLKWGSYGAVDGKFNLPSSLAIDEAGNVLVVDHYNHRIQKFDSNGNYLTKFGTYGRGDGQLNGPYGIALDAMGLVYVSDFYNHRVVKFAPAF
jgi:streptogramin lyase